MAHCRRDDDICLLNEDSLCTQIADVSGVFDKDAFKDAVDERLQFSKFAMAAGSTTYSNQCCELFEEIECAIADVKAEIRAINAGNLNGVSAKLLSKIWQVHHSVTQINIDSTTQLNK